MSKDNVERGKMTRKRDGNGPMSLEFWKEGMRLAKERNKKKRMTGKTNETRRIKTDGPIENDDRSNDGDRR